MVYDNVFFTVVFVPMNRVELDSSFSHLQVTNKRPVNVERHTRFS